MLKRGLLFAFLLSLIVILTACSSETTAPSDKASEPAKEQAQPTEQPVNKPSEPVAGEQAKGVVQRTDIEKLYVDSCGGCHGQTRLGALGPNLLPERLFSGMKEEDIFKVIKEGRPGTPMPAFNTVSKDRSDDATIRELIEYLKTPVALEAQTWSLEDAKASLEVINDEKTLPAQPTAWDPNEIEIGDLMVAMERETRKYAVMDGKNHKLLGKIDGSYRTHTIQFGPADTPEGRYMYGIGRDGWLFKVDMYSFKTVRKVRVGLDSRGTAVSADGEYIAISNYLPSSVMILDKYLNPLKYLPTYGIDPDGQIVGVNGSQSRAAAILDTVIDGKQMFVVALKEAGRVWGIDVSKEGAEKGFPIVVDVPRVGRILHDGFLDDSGRYFMIASQGDNTKPSLLDPSKPDNGLMGIVDMKEGKLVSQLPAGIKPHPGPGAVIHTKKNGVLYATPAIGENLVTFWKQTKNGFEVYKQVRLGKEGENGGSLFIRAYNGIEGKGEAQNYVWVDIAFAPNWNKVFVIDKESLEVVKEIDTAAIAGTDPQKTRSVHPEYTQDGKFVYVALWEGNAVLVFKPNGDFVTKIDGPVTPTGIFSYGARAAEPGI
ncbi:nitrite reductase [Microaerobacter geothermalis]|uniref:nitrite reductase n=1 Tax=Microaerobacter geothermalis TaxID=674972 RepID=UPI001F3AE54B|nr:nitrite reductase [Microaerobacter geothermalis]MCF6093114.1 nitrite reductase [Microaerobacter geothermalis]